MPKLYYLYDIKRTVNCLCKSDFVSDEEKTDMERQREGQKERDKSEAKRS